VGFDGPLTYAGLNKVKEKPIPLFLPPCSSAAGRSARARLLARRRGLGKSAGLGVWGELAGSWGGRPAPPLGWLRPWTEIYASLARFLKNRDARIIAQRPD